MPPTEEEREVAKRLNEVKNAVIALKSRLNELGEQKESWFEKKEAVSSKIRELIGRLKENRAKRNSLTDRVKAAKAERSRLTGIVHGKISAAKELNQQKKKAMEKYAIKSDPGHIMQEIERMETYIETNVFSFEKEKELMKKLKELKKKHTQASELSSLWSQANSSSKEIDAMKEAIEKTHRAIQQQAAESQKLHEAVLEDSKEVDRLSVEEKEYYGKFMQFRKDFSEVNSQLKGNLSELNQLYEKMDSFRTAKRKKSEQKENEFFRRKEEEIEDKIRRGEKLTTEDLLIFQKREKN